jgi:hypothetical protein
MPGDTNSTWWDTRARAAALIESLPLYRVCERELIEWCQSGLTELGMVGDYMASLEEYLSQYPFYVSILGDVAENGSRTPVKYLDVSSVAMEIGMSEGYLRKHLSTMPTSLPFGSFNERRKWNIHPLDVPVLHEYFESARRSR